MKKKLVSLMLVLALAVGAFPAVFAAEEQPRYAITEEVVIIDYVKYEIVDNTIQYEGKTYEIDDYKLITYDDNNDPIYFVLPVEQARVTDPEQIAILNAAIGKTDSLARAVPSSPVDLPYTANVAKGDYLTVTPAFNIINNSRFQRSTNLSLSNLPLSSDGRYYIIFSTCDVTGTWTSHEFHRNFLGDPILKIANSSSMAYGMFTITNLYDDPSPAYTYTVYLSTP